MEATPHAPGTGLPAHIYTHVVEVRSRTDPIDDIHFENGLNLGAVIRDRPNKN